MKIQVIRGQNLASLSGDFEVDLCSAPLSGAGLFAITGQTGSGKSTLLDAMCLALFGLTPRLSTRGGGSVGRDEEDKKRQANGNDPRTVLRRGSGEGFAEVEFRGVDGRSYRARWSVRRARNKASGKLQPATHELWDVAENKRLDSDKKTITLQYISQRLGLGFKQFRRSVLLPQGDFAAFLKASEADRGALLERMTGTGIYREISIAAHKRARDEALSFTRLEEQVAVIGTLSDEAIAELRDGIVHAAGERERLQGERTRLARTRDWHRRFDELAQAVREAEAAAVAAGSAREGMAKVRAELTAIAAVDALRPLLDASARSAGALSGAEAEEARVAARLTEAVSTAASAEQADAEAATALQEAREKQEEMSAALLAAAELDARIVDSSRAMILARRQSTEADSAQSEAASALAALTAQIAGAEQNSAAEAAWLSDCSALSTLAGDWPRWSRQLERVAAAIAEEAAIEVSLARCQRTADAAEAERGAAEQALTTARSALVPLLEVLAAAESTLAGRSSAALQAERENLYERRRTLEVLVGLRQTITTAHARRARLRQSVVTAEEAARTADASSAAAAAQRQQASWMLSEAERFLEQVRSDEVLSRLRKTLVEAEPCPLCGSPEHPWGKGALAHSSLYDNQVERVTQLNNQLNELKLLEHQGRLDQARHTEAAAAAQAELEALAERLKHLSAAWSDELLSLPVPAEAAAMLAEAQASNTAALGNNQKALSALVRQQVAVETARSQEVAGRTRCDAASARRREAEHAAGEAHRALTDAAHRRSALSTQLTEGLDVLTEPMSGEGDWQVSLRTNPERFVQSCQERVTRYHRAEKVVKKSAEVLRTLRPQQLANQARLKERQVAAVGFQRAYLERLEGVKDLETQRTRLLGSQKTEDVRRALKRTTAEAEAARQQAGQRLGGARQRVAELSARRQAAEAAVLARRTESLAASADLSETLSQRGLALDDVRQRLSRPTEWVAEQRGLLRDIDAAWSDAGAVLSERRQQHLRHSTTEPPEQTAEEAEQRATELTAELEVVSRRLFETEARLKQDGENRKKAAALLARRDKQRGVAEHWAVMNKLIGSASGKVFSQFAQSLTLDALLVQANAHLEGLSRRYSLMRVPGEDLLLQIIDHYHGEEVRSINSLSGGESFLVSLALALGLATLSARDTQIGSLFIDEGFGTLDPDTLDVALSSLEALQASGRQVGLISHVPGMAERIGIQVQVIPRGGGRSIVRVVGGG
ncbi:MAG: AAA family ATPase [Myxococcota bacterium]|nr:AAA family ATPase [Myxococcota bacterium]